MNKSYFAFEAKPKEPKEKNSFEELNVDLLCEHVAMLEKFYSTNKKPKPPRRRNMVKEINEKTENIVPSLIYEEITEEQVAKWFECRRKKDKG